MVKTGIVAVVVFCFFRFGLEPFSWFFYHASHALNVDGLYWGYRGFRMAGFFLAESPYHTLVSIAAALIAGGVCWLFVRRKAAKVDK